MKYIQTMQNETTIHAHHFCPRDHMSISLLPAPDASQKIAFRHMENI
jgi:hypothetical protein